MEELKKLESETEEQYLWKIGQLVDSGKVDSWASVNNIVNKEEKNLQLNLPVSLSNEAKIVYNQLDKQIFTCDDLLSPELNSNDILSALGELELYGYVSLIPGGRYTLK